MTMGTELCCHAHHMPHNRIGMVTGTQSKAWQPGMNACVGQTHIHTQAQGIVGEGQKKAGTHAGTQAHIHKAHSQTEP